MTFGFPAYHTEEFTLVDPPCDMEQAVRTCFALLNWGLDPSAPASRLVALAPISLNSWGERIEVEVLSGSTIRVTSKYKVPLACIDFGRNARNVSKFIDQFNNLGELDEDIWQRESSAPSRVPLIAAAVPLVLYPAILPANVMSLAALLERQPNVFTWLFHLRTTGFLVFSTFYPFFFAFCYLKFRDLTRTRRRRAAKLYSWLPLVYLIGVAGLLVLWIQSA